MDIKTAIDHVINGKDLSQADMHHVMQTIMQGNATPAQIGGLLIALRLKGESVAEITAAAQVMRELAEPVAVEKTHLVDTCGTGGDGTNTFNISTTAAFVVSASGARVAKHGNRSVSSKSGSADVVKAAGIKLELSPQQAASCIESVGIGFMFAPMHHSAMKHAIDPRRELGVRTLFNVLGPLTNPAGAPNQVIGVFARQWQDPLAEALQSLGSEHVLVVYAEDGMDEISISGKTYITELKNGEIDHFEIAPDDFSMTNESISAIAVNTVDDSLQMMLAVLSDSAPLAAKNIVCLNAGAAIYAAGITDSIQAGVEKAANLIESGNAKQKLESLINYTQSL